jgi:hypothetical protein
LALFFFCLGQGVAADVSLAWDASASPDISGYKLYRGTGSGSYDAPVEVGNQTAYTVTGLTAGTYYFAVTAVNTTGDESDFSNEVFTTITGSGDSTAPTITITSPTSSLTYSTATGTLNLGGMSSDNVGVTQVAWTNSRGGSGTASGTTNWTVNGIVLQSGSNVITVTASDAAGNSRAVTLTVTYTPADQTAPTIAISAPTSNATYSTATGTLNLGGTSSDNVGVTQVAWTNSRGGSGTASGTTNWTVNGIVLLSGSNVITATASDAAGNSVTDTLTVTYTPPDLTAPTIAISAPTSDATYGTAIGTLNLGGTSSDNVGVTQVTWANSRGGSGTASGTTNWTVNGIVLQSGSNIITVMASDLAGNSGISVLTVTYTLSDLIPPTITINSPTSNATYNTATRTLNLGGTSSDNVGVTQVTWANSRGGSGTASGTTNWQVSGITLQSGSNIITVTARDAAGNSRTDTLTATYTPSEQVVPIITISSPTSNATYNTTTETLNLSGTSSDNVGVTQVAWTNSRGGSGTASGTTNWSVAGITLQSGSNVITVMASDAAGNSGVDTLSVVYTDENTPPVISNVSVSRLTPDSATILWTTDKASDSQVEFGAGSSYTNRISDTATVTSHSVTLTGLSARTLYHYRVQSNDESGNPAVSGDFTFTTNALAMSDFNNDSKSDILWRNVRTGDVSISPLTRTQVYATRAGAVADLSWKISGIGDFNGDGKPDILWRHYGQGENYVWFMEDTSFTSGAYLDSQKDLDYKIAGVGDFNADGKPDILWRRQGEGTYSVWFMNGAYHVGGADLESQGDISWQVAAISDFDKDGNSDILWRNYATGDCRIELMNGTSLKEYRNLENVADLNWIVVSVGDYIGDGQLEILWRHARTNNFRLWYMNGAAKISDEDLGQIQDSNYLAMDFGQAAAGSDFDNDGNSDLLWRDPDTGDNTVWLMNGTNYNGGYFLPSALDPNWKIAVAADINKDGRLDLVWRNQATGENSVWFMNGKARINSTSLPVLSDINWNIVAAADFNNDGSSDLLWRNSATGENCLWLMNGMTRVEIVVLDSSADLNWNVLAAADFNKDGNPDILWANNTTGESAVWFMNGISYVSQTSLGNIENLDLRLAAIGDFNKDGSPDLVWRNPATGENEVWYMDGVSHFSGASLPTVTGQRWRITDTIQTRTRGPKAK